MYTHRYHIGTPGKKWGKKEKSVWLSEQTIKRSYQDEVVARLKSLAVNMELITYGILPYQLGRYPLYALKTRHWQKNKPTVLITGGVHGYETSGVQGAIAFIETRSDQYGKIFNLLVAPCVSPWGYETINRWNPHAIDPNRSFYANSPSLEASALMQLVTNLETTIFVHIDLHETTDTDNSEFRPALAAKDGIVNDSWNIPDGFYLVGDSENPVPDFQKTIIESVEQVTHIAPADENGDIIGEPVAQHGVINYAVKALGLCAGMTSSQYVTTTEVYPDSSKVTPQLCSDAQVAAVSGALDFLNGH